MGDGLSKIDNATSCDISRLNPVKGDSLSYSIDSQPDPWNGGSKYFLSSIDRLTGAKSKVCSVFSTYCGDVAAKLQQCYDLKHDKDPVSEVPVEYQGVLGLVLSDSAKESVRTLLRGAGCYSIVLSDRALPTSYQDRKNRQFEFSISCYVDVGHQQMKTLCSTNVGQNSTIMDALKECNPAGTSYR